MVLGEEGDYPLDLGAPLLCSSKTSADAFGICVVWTAGHDPPIADVEGELGQVRVSACWHVDEDAVVSVLVVKVGKCVDQPFLALGNVDGCEGHVELVEDVAALNEVKVVADDDVIAGDGFGLAVEDRIGDASAVVGPCLVGVVLGLNVEGGYEAALGSTSKRRMRSPREAYICPRSRVVVDLPIPPLAMVMA